MPDNFKPAPAPVEPQKESRRRRSTYSAMNASYFVDAFVLAAKNKQETMWYYADNKRFRPATLYQKACDALRYLVNESDTDAMFALLKAKMVIKQETQGVALRFRNKEGLKADVLVSSGGLSEKMARISVQTFVEGELEDISLVYPEYSDDPQLNKRWTKEFVEDLIPDGMVYTITPNGAVLSIVR